MKRSFEIRGDQSSDHDEVQIAVSQRTAQPAVGAAATAIGAAAPGVERLLAGGEERRPVDREQLGRLPGRQGAGQIQSDDDVQRPWQGLQDAGTGARDRGPTQGSRAPRGEPARCVVRYSESTRVTRRARLSQGKPFVRTKFEK